nr:TPA_asm: hypothetical protein [Pseudomonas aeruginosa]
MNNAITHSGPDRTLIVLITNHVDGSIVRAKTGRGSFSFRNCINPSGIYNPQRPVSYIYSGGPILSIDT